MHFFKFQRTWFYLADQRRLHSGYQTMSTIKGTLKHSKKDGGERGIWREEKGESSKVQKDNSQNFKSLARERGEKRNKIREPKRRNSSHILEIIQNITQSQKKYMQKHAHIRCHSLLQNPSHLTILSWKAISKQSYLDLSSKSHKFYAKALSL